MLRQLAVLSALITAVSGCSPDRTRTAPNCIDDWEPQPGTPVFHISTVEYEILGIPGTVQGEFGSFCLQNDGTVTHELRISPIQKGQTLEEVVSEDISPKDLPLAFLSHSAAPGQFTTFGMALDPGPHAYACFFRNSEGKTHASLGMRGGFTVT